ncbi:MAG TPA: PepSY-like domain-containing protein [Bacteroidia bacterium]|jgi:hypothetical protein|nr:PepSY-like domain-containing protein [Bacteroidia bacterium]
MKKIFIIPALFFAYSCEAQKMKAADVPEAVKNVVTAKYPGVKVETWSKEDGNYEAEFDVNNQETSLLMKEDGTVLETETEIAVADLPQGAKDYVTKNFPGKKIKEASKIVASDGAITYEAEVNGVDQIFDANGVFLKASKE